MIPRFVLYDNSISPQVKQCLELILDQCDKDDDYVCYASASTIGGYMGIRREKVYPYLQLLEDKGLIVSKKRNGQTTVYLPSAGVKKELGWE